MAHTVLVLADPTEKQLALLDRLPEDTSLAVGNRADAFERLADEADVLFNWSGSPALLKEVFLMTPRVRWIHNRSAGLDGGLLFPELLASPVPLTNGRGVFSQSLGEFALAAILHFAKGLRRMVRSQEAGIWDPFDIVEIAGQTVGIVGYGDIGRAVARRAKAMDMKVLALRRNPARSSGDELVDEVFATDRRLEMLPRCDYVVVAAPLTEETRGLVGSAELAAMKPEAVVVNIGRGPVIDEAALIEALRERRIQGAALDVFDREPLPEGHPFYALDNVLLSPHCADHTSDWLDQAMLFFVRNFERYRKGEELLNVVDKRAGY